MVDEREDAVLDCTGLLCPMPMVMIVRKIRTMEPGQVVKVLTTDRGTSTDVPAWAADTGNDLLYWQVDGRQLVFYIRKGTGVP
jgi:tRNA 2-thiouridine synthesizing protein A